MNLPPISETNLPLIESLLAEARSKKITYCRITCSMPELTASRASGLAVPNWELLDRVVGLFATYGRKAVVGLYTQVPNSKYWRAFKTVPGSPEDTALWNDWKAREASGFAEHWKTPIGLSDWLKVPVIDFFKTFCGHWPSGTIFQLDNEPGNTVNALRYVWGTILPGTVTQEFKDFQLAVAKEVTALGYSLASTPWETEDEPTFLTQVDTGEGLFIRYCKYQSINWYLTHWKANDTATSWATRAWAEITLANSQWLILNKPLIVTEIYPLDAPTGVVDACLSELRRLRPTKIPILTTFDMRILK